MQKSVLLAGATGDLGLRIARRLRATGAHVRCLVRPNANASTCLELRQLGAELKPMDRVLSQTLGEACQGVDVVLSAVSGLRPIIVDFQNHLMEAALAAGVPRFIPSDFSIDYRTLARGENRNLEWRAEFRAIIDARPSIRATSILNGAFMEMLTGVAPFILVPIKRILCWGDPQQLMDWTSIDDVAQVAALAALDDEAPRDLTIAGDEVSAQMLAEIMGDLTGSSYRILRPGGPGVLRVCPEITKIRASPTREPCMRQRESSRPLVEPVSQDCLAGAGLAVDSSLLSLAS